jgi:hypothetical protein
LANSTATRRSISPRTSSSPGSPEVSTKTVGRNLKASKHRLVDAAIEEAELEGVEGIAAFGDRASPGSICRLDQNAAAGSNFNATPFMQ